MVIKKFLLPLFLFFPLLLFSYSVKDAIKFQKQHQYQKAIEIYYKHKDTNLTALNNLAMLLFLGKGLKTQQGKAVNLLENAMKKHKKLPNVIKFNLALMYWQGYFDNQTQKAFVRKKDAVKILKELYAKHYKPAIMFVKNNNIDLNATKK